MATNSPHVSVRGMGDDDQSDCGRRRVSTEASEGVQRYPGNVWTAARIAGEAIVLEAGWLLDETVRKVAVRAFGTDGLMTHTSFATELRGSAAVVAGSRGAMSAAAAEGGGGNGASTMGSSKGSDGGEQTAPGRQNVLGGELQVRGSMHLCHPLFLRSRFESSICATWLLYDVFRGLLRYR